MNHGNTISLLQPQLTGSSISLHFYQRCTETLQPVEAKCAVRPCGTSYKALIRAMDGRQVRIELGVSLVRDDAHSVTGYLISIDKKNILW